MSKKTELLIKEIRQNLITNLWRVVNNNPVDIFKFGEFLTDKFIQSGKQVKFIDITLVYEYSKSLELEYATLLDYITSNIAEGDIIEIEKYVKHKVNGSFTTLIQSFIYNHDKKNQEVN